jgi:hypothetical protein
MTHGWIVENSEGGLEYIEPRLTKDEGWLRIMIEAFSELFPRSVFGPAIGIIDRSEFDDETIDHAMERITNFDREYYADPPDAIELEATRHLVEIVRLVSKAYADEVNPYREGQTND